MAQFEHGQISPPFSFLHMPVIIIRSSEHFETTVQHVSDFVFMFLKSAVYLVKGNSKHGPDIVTRNLTYSIKCGHLVR